MANGKGVEIVLDRFAHIMKWRIHYQYGSSTDERIAFLQKNLDLPNRKSRLDGATAKWLWYELQHHLRRRAAGRSQLSPAEIAYNTPSPLLSRLRKATNFAGQEFNETIPYLPKKP